MNPGPRLLQQILDELRNLGAQAMVVFDLDSTLFDVSPRIQKILNDFAATPAHRLQFPQSIERMKNLQTRPTDWGIRTVLNRHGLQTQPSEFLDAIRHYWIDRFFAGDYLQHDRPLAGAVDFAQKVSQSGVRLVYLTGRDQEKMQVASTMVLASHDFPKAELVLKPTKGTDDALFKVDWFSAQDLAQYQSIYFFENEPLNLIQVHARHPQVKVVFVDSTHSGKAQARADWPTIADFLLT